jgi:hypothetical protein
MKKVSGQLYSSTASFPGKDRLVPIQYVGSRTSLGIVEKRKISCPCRESKPDSSAV